MFKNLILIMSCHMNIIVLHLFGLQCVLATSLLSLLVANVTSISASMALALTVLFGVATCSSILGQKRRCALSQI